MEFIERPTRYLFFTGKGGVGKTSIACATALTLAERGRRVLLVSTDPASNLDQVLDTSLGRLPRPVPGAEGLSALNIDPEAAAQAYRDRALAPLLGTATEAELDAVREQLSGACTVEIAAFDEFTSLLAGGGVGEAFDHVVFDTAPTGHTLRLLHLPAAWTEFIDVNPRGASCLGPSSALKSQHVQYLEAVSALADPARTTLVLVARPERGALDEAGRTAEELLELGIANQRLVINGVFAAQDPHDRIASAMERRGQAALADASMPVALQRIRRHLVPLKPFNIVGLDAIRALLQPDLPVAALDALIETPDVPPLGALIDELEGAQRGLVLVMGKGGVGKTTIAAAVAVELAARGHQVQLTTTDPAAHVAGTVADHLPNLEVSRIDPAAERQRYIDRVLASKGKDLDDAGRALLLEDLQSPCTEEVAVFHAFSRFISKARSGFVVLDTAPTGHTLLLLDTTGAYHTEMMRGFESQSGLSGVTTPLMRLRDAAYTKVMIVALPETTPVEEAASLQRDLRRAGIEPWAWVLNSSLAATDTTDPVLRARAAAEGEHIARVHQELANRVALVPWQPEEPVGVERLRELARVAQLAAHASAGA